MLTRSDEILLSKNIMLFGISESAAEYVLSDMMLMSSNPTIAPYCGDGEVRLRVTARAKTPEVCEKKCAKAIEQILHTSVSDYFYGINTSLEKAVVTEACKLGLHVTTAESCTGGLTAGAITAVPGSSAVFGGGVVTYSNDMKKKLLGVRDETLRDFGAVSPETAREGSWSSRTYRSRYFSICNRNRRPGRRLGGKTCRTGLYSRSIQSRTHKSSLASCSLPSFCLRMLAFYLR